MMDAMTEPRCPRCNGKLMKREEKLYWCAHCNCLTDGQDDGTPYVGDTDITETQGPLGNDTGGGKRVIRSTKNLS